jgi:hypothetical protein
MIVCGIPKWTDTHLTKILKVFVVVMFFLQAVRMVIFENQSTTTNTQSMPFFMDERPYMYSIEMDSQGL